MSKSSFSRNGLPRKSSAPAAIASSRLSKKNAGRDHEDARLIPAGELANAARGFQAIHFRHAQIHEHHARAPLLEGGHGLYAIRYDFRFKPHRLQEAGEQFAIFRRIVNDQDSQGRLARGQVCPHGDGGPSSPFPVPTEAAASTGISTKKRSLCRLRFRHGFRRPSTG